MTDVDPKIRIGLVYGQNTGPFLQKEREISSERSRQFAPLIKSTRNFTGDLKYVDSVY